MMKATWISWQQIDRGHKWSQGVKQVWRKSKTWGIKLTEKGCWEKGLKRHFTRQICNKLHVVKSLDTSWQQLLKNRGSACYLQIWHGGQAAHASTSGTKAKIETFSLLNIFCDIFMNSFSYPLWRPERLWPYLLTSSAYNPNILLSPVVPKSSTPAAVKP